MKLLTVEEIKIKKKKEEIEAQKRIFLLEKEEARLIKSINDKREELKNLQEK